LIDFIYWPIFLVLFFNTWTLFHAFYCSAPAAWIQVLSFGVCFKSVSSFCRPQYLLRTSPRSIPRAWNSRIWHFYLNNTLLPRRNVWNLVFATSRPESMKSTCQFRRFLASTFRPLPYRDWLLGESCWTKQMMGMRGKKLHKNRKIVVGWMVRVVGA